VQFRTLRLESIIEHKSGIKLGDLVDAEIKRMKDTGQMTHDVEVVSGDVDTDKQQVTLQLSNSEELVISWAKPGQRVIRKDVH
jgi:hypothetical protein